MRPLSIALDGFRSYATKSEFDFRNQRLIGIVGPIGSGKSSILDAVAFALYGVTPAERSSTKSLIHQRADAARVELVFETEGQVWRAVRVLRKAGQSEHALYRYTSDEAFQEGEQPVETVLKKGEVDHRIEQLLGLDFAAFNRSVLLAQGRFAELLRATPTQRDEVLKGVFGFDLVGRMERLAKLRRDTAAREVEQLGAERSSLDEVRQRLAAAQIGQARASSRNAELDSIEPELTAQTEQAAELSRNVEAAVVRLKELAELSDRMPEPGATDSILTAAAEANRVGSSLEERAGETRRRAQAASRAVAEALEEVGGENALSKAVAVVSELTMRRQAEEEIRQRKARAESERALALKVLSQSGSHLEKCSADETAALARQTQAEAAVGAAEYAHHDAQHADMASALRRDIQVGDVCPVCAQTVHQLPDLPDIDLTETERALEAARSRLSDATSSARSTALLNTAAAKDVEAAEAAVGRSERAVRELDEELGITEAAIGALATGAEQLLGVGDPPELLDGKQQTLLKHREAAQEAAVLADEAQRRSEAAQIGARLSSSALEDIAARLHGIAGRLGEEIVIGKGPGDVQFALDQLRGKWTETQAAAVRTKSELEQALATCRHTREELMVKVGLDPTSEFSETKAAVQAELAGLSAEIKIFRERLEGASDLVERVTKADERLALYKALVSELTPSRFLNFLLREERAVLSDLGSHQFEELSAGRYRFSDDGEFDIVDLTAAEQVRRADSLSGGETFLASLALALALAEIVTRGGGRLDALFLDEGFGSLDSEHLDLAMAGIERLVTDHEDRLVVIVSHVAEMRERLEELIILDKDPATGSTVVLRAPGAA